MQDKNTPQDWTADENFWDEAWADMDARLGKKKRRRGAWLWLVGVVMIIAVGVAAEFYETSPPAPLPGKGKQVQAEAKAVLKSPNQPASPADDLSSAPEQFSALKTNTGQPTYPTISPIETEKRDQVVTETEPPLEKKLGATPLSPPRASQKLSLLPITSLQVENPLPPLQITIENRISKSPPKSHLSLLLATNAYARELQPGISAQLAYHRQLSDNWYLPVALRYDFSRRRVFPTEETQEYQELASQDFSTPVTSTPGLEVTAADELRNYLAEPGDRDLTTHTLELRTGVGRQLGPKFSLSGGAGLSYLLGGRGPSFGSLGEPIPLTSDFDASRFAFDLNNFVGMSAGRTTPSNIRDISRWGITGWAAAEYRVSGLLRLRFGYTRNFTDLYPSELVGAAKNRFEIGVRFVR